MKDPLTILYGVMSIIALVGIVWVTIHDKKMRKAKQQ